MANATTKTQSKNQKLERQPFLLIQPIKLKVCISLLCLLSFFISSSESAVDTSKAVIHHTASHDVSAKIDLNKIIMIESSGNPLADNDKYGRGLFQITEICLKEYNNFHSKSKYSMNDLWDSSINAKIASWYINKRIPQMLRYYNKSVTIDNILIAYNAGISYVVNGKSLPKTTRDYLRKYKKWRDL